MDESQRIRNSKTQTETATHIIRRRRLDLGLLADDINPRLTAGDINTTELASGIRAITPAELSTMFGLQRVPILPEDLPTVTSVSFEAYDFVMRMIFNGNVTGIGNAAVTARGVVWNMTGTPTLTDNIETDISGGTGSFSIIFNAMDMATIYARAYATNSFGTSYGTQLSAVSQLCLAEGTLITLADFSVKPIENITYNDILLVWNFDVARLDFAKPLWIKKKEYADKYNLLTFDNGIQLKTINQHRIFNKDAGAFTYPMTDATPVGTSTFMWNGMTPKLTSKNIIETPVAHYNIITEKHMNVFANSILTSCRYNNIYPIVNMRFVKQIGHIIHERFIPITRKYMDGLRIDEQSFTDDEIIDYVNRMKLKEI